MLVSGMLLFFAAFPPGGFGQSVPLNRSHPLYPAGQMEFPLQPAPPSIDIVAVMVEFRQDDNRFTSGDGTFGPGSLPWLEDNPITIDPLPHDRAYFESHLEFARNYFNTVSGGQFGIDFQVLPDVYSLDQPMEFYSPTGETFTNEKLALLARDTWQKVEEAGGFDASGLDPGQTAFIIFHAGVGRDIELVGTTLDITPQDIPSLFLSKESLGQLLDNPSFDGFPVNNGSFTIGNSLILPRTLSRRGEDVTGREFVLQLSINGLLAASIGSYLGLPDLFNTETGASAIGRFGLMDGESFFSYRGLFPPEPSAWEKVALGWQTPSPVTLDETAVSLPAASLHQAGSIARYSVSLGEYFLVENRHRDPDGNGAVLTIRRSDGTAVQQSFSNSDEAFINQTQGFEDLLEAGVVVDVDNFDWSLPGGLDPGEDEEAGTPDDRPLNGGILIWHIDEAVIEREIENHAVNANAGRRGVDLEEADGAQDIGRAASDNLREESRGTAFDFWWSGNDYSVITPQSDTLSLYQNRFGPDTKPSSATNSGAPSFVEFYDFSDNLPVASFRARRTSFSGIEAVDLPISTIPSENFTAGDDPFSENYPPALSIYTAQNDTFLIIPSAGSTYALQLNSDTGALFDFGQITSRQPLLTVPLVLGTQPDAGSSIELNAWQWDGTAWQNSWQSVTNAGKGFLSSIEGDTLLVDFTDNRFLVADGSPLPDFQSPRQQSVSLNGQTSILTQGGLSVTGSGISVPVDGQDERLYTGAVQLGQAGSGFFLLTDNAFSFIRPEEADPLKTIVEGGGFDWPALADFDQDGNMDILYTDIMQNRLAAKNQNGAFLDYFPLPAPQGTRFTGTPLIADIENDGEPDLIIAAQDSLSLNIYAYNNKGEIKQGFPLYVGNANNPQYQPVYPLLHENTLYAIGHDGTLKAWHFPEMNDILWSSRYGNEAFNKVTGRLSGNNTPPDLPSLLVKNETYNWPNPADDNTRIRYQVRQQAEVELKVITVSGRVVYRQKLESAGGLPEEHLIDTSAWESGIYLAMITARAGSNKQQKMIKIAVVH